MTHGKFVVQLDRSVYLAGQVVTGRVCLYLDAAETVTCECGDVFFLFRVCRFR